jgi:hypothetical protein
MIEREYAKATNAAKLAGELVAAGLPQDPSAGARFYGVSSQPGIPKTVVYVYDDATAGELASIDAVVTAHVNAAWVVPSEKFTVRTYQGMDLIKEEWFGVDNNDGTYAQKGREISYTYAASKLTRKVEKRFYTDGTVYSQDTTDYFTNSVTGQKIEKRS